MKRHFTEAEMKEGVPLPIPGTMAAYYGDGRQGRQVVVDALPIELAVGSVEIVTATDGRSWVNVDGICIVRITKTLSAKLEKNE